VTRNVRLPLLLVGFGILALLVWRAGPRLLLSLLIRVGWSFPAIAAIYAAYVGARAVALWRSVPGGAVGLTDALRIRLSGQAIETLSLSGPVFAEPAKGWLLKRRGLTTVDAFAAVVTEYVLYNVTCAWVAALAVSWLLARGSLPHAARLGAIAVLATTIAFIAVFAFAAITGVGLIVPILRASHLLIGARRATRAARTFGRIEKVLVAFLHVHHGRLAEVLAIETASQLLLMLEIWIVIGALGFSPSWGPPFIIEGGGKFIGIAFAFIPGQFGAAEGVYALLAGAIGLPTAAGLTLALVRRIRSLLLAAAGVVALAMFDARHGSSHR